MVVHFLYFIMYFFRSSDGKHNGEFSRDACVRIEQRRIYFGNCVKRNPIGRRTDGSGTQSIKFQASMMKIVIPQAVKNILPTRNEFIALSKKHRL